MEPLDDRDLSEILSQLRLDDQALDDLLSQLRLDDKALSEILSPCDDSYTKYLDVHDRDDHTDEANDAGQVTDGAECRRRLREELSAYKLPRHYFFYAKTDLPFTDSGKIDKHRLISMLSERIESGDFGT